MSGARLRFFGFVFCFVWLGVVFAKLNLIFEEWKCRKINIQLRNQSHSLIHS